MEDEIKCSCDGFEKLSGASVPAYTLSFLERVGDREDYKGMIFRCRVCGRLWQRESPRDKAEGKRDSLIRLPRV